MFSLSSLFSCLVCGKRYKNRPGLSYHYAHTHLASEEGDEAQDQETRSPPNHRNENHRREFPVIGAAVKWVVGRAVEHSFYHLWHLLVVIIELSQCPVVNWLFQPSAPVGQLSSRLTVSGGWGSGVGGMAQ